MFLNIQLGPNMLVICNINSNTGTTLLLVLIKSLYLYCNVARGCGDPHPHIPYSHWIHILTGSKFHILTGSHLINRKTELLNKCPHRRKYLACNVKAWHHSYSSFDTQSVILCMLTTLCVYLSVGFLVWIVTIYFVNLVWRGIKYRNGCNHNRIVSLVYIYIYIYIYKSSEFEKDKE